MALFFIYRKRGGRLTGSSDHDPRTHPEFRTHLEGVVQDPAIGGLDFSTPKVVDAGVIRDATAAEIDTFDDDEHKDNLAEARTLMKERGANDVLVRSMLETISTISGSSIAAVTAAFDAAVDSRR
jgi:hypothetical protein